MTCSYSRPKCFDLHVTTYCKTINCYCGHSSPYRHSSTGEVTRYPVGSIRPPGSYINLVMGKQSQCLLKANFVFPPTCPGYESDGVSHTFHKASRDFDFRFADESWARSALRGRKTIGTPGNVCRGAFAPQRPPSTPVTDGREESGSFPTEKRKRSRRAESTAFSAVSGMNAL